ncbi:MerR family transcriptional regulator [Actinokineospora sp. 24-640]
MTDPTQLSPRTSPKALDEPLLTIAAVARRLGVAPATLRTWNRRYGVGPTGHTPGRHRRYTPTDVHRLELMQRALLKGASSAEYALRAATDPQPAPPIPPARGGHGGGQLLITIYAGFLALQRNLPTEARAEVLRRLAPLRRHLIQGEEVQPDGLADHLRVLRAAHMLG